MREALERAAAAAGQGEVPVAAVVTDRDGTVIAAARRVERDNDPAHAEIIAMREAAAILGSPRLEGCDLGDAGTLRDVQARSVTPGSAALLRC